VSLPLSGITVVELDIWAFCPSAGATLASWGADVIHLEGPGRPDPMRVSHGGTLEPGRSNVLFRHYNRGKRAVSLDLTSALGQEAFASLIKTADVFLTSHLPATRRKLGVDVDQIRALNPNIVYAKGTGAGPQGPEADRGGYDLATWWTRGTLSASLMAVAGTSAPAGMVGHGDGMSGLVFAGGICAALAQRARTGQAAVVDGSLLASALWFNAPTITTSALGPQRQLFYSQPPRAQVHWTINSYRTADDRFIVLTFVGDEDRHFLDLCRHLDRADLASDERFSSAERRGANSSLLISVLDPIFATRPLAEWRTQLATTSGVWSFVQTPEEVLRDPQVVANRFISTVSYPDVDLPMVASPVMFDGVATTPTRCPDFGEHTDAVLGELGYRPEDLHRMREAGAID
jgi:crotonobetainyl-CoA:carnitine CoA-transferase CaiB-like acyl-CoA transferase